MKILFLTQVLPFPLDAGPKIRAYYVARHLASAGHDLTLLSFVRSGDRAEHVDHLRKFCTRVDTILLERSRLRDAFHLVRALVKNEPFVICRDENARMFARVRELVQASRFEAVHADQLWMAPYALAARSVSDSLLVLDQHNAVFQIPDRIAIAEPSGVKRAILRREAKRLYLYERELCGRFDTVVWVSHQDRQAVNAFNETSCHEVIPICVDPEFRPLASKSFRTNRVTFLGGLHWPPNAQGVLWFAREVWPEIRRRIPEARFTIIGKDPPAEIAQAGTEGIDVTGYVDNVEPLLKETAVFVVPLLAGGGMRVKILEAWCRGLPVVSTTIGAEGIQIKEGSNCLIADSPRDFATAVIRVFREWWLSERLSRLGRATVETEYNWRRAYRSWDKVYCSSQGRVFHSERTAKTTQSVDWLARAR